MCSKQSTMRGHRGWFLCFSEPFFQEPDLNSGKSRMGLKISRVGLKVSRIGLDWMFPSWGWRFPGWIWRFPGGDWRSPGWDWQFPGWIWRFPCWDWRFPGKDWSLSGSVVVLEPPAWARGCKELPWTAQMRGTKKKSASSFHFKLCKKQLPQGSASDKLK